MTIPIKYLLNKVERFKSFVCRTISSIPIDDGGDALGIDIEPYADLPPFLIITNAISQAWPRHGIDVFCQS